MRSADVVIAGYAETPIRHRSGKTAYELAADVLHEVVEKTGIPKSAIDGLGVTAALSEAANPFHGAYLGETLGLELDWLQTGSVGGCSMLSSVAAAASALRDGRCRVALVIGADAPSTRYQSRYGAYRPEFQDPTGLTRPPQAFGLIQNAYEQRYGNPDEALAKLVVLQREHGLANELACPKLRVPLGRDDYFSSRLVSDPLRLLDSVMFCDGANAVLMMSPITARSFGLADSVRIAGYAERSNFEIENQTPDLTRSGFNDVGPRVLGQAGLDIPDIDLIQLYDDFTIAVLLQLEQIGFCEAGDGAGFIERTDLSIRGRPALNTGGGQLSAGQPGLASGGVGLIEATRQLFGEAGRRQVDAPTNALVTGIGGIAYGRGWIMSSALVLTRDAES